MNEDKKEETAPSVPEETSGTEGVEVPAVPATEAVPSEVVPPKKKRGGRPRKRTRKFLPPPKTENGTANPQLLEDPAQLYVDTVDLYKKSDCKYYEDCLEFAAKKGWSQFHCRSCDVYERNEEADRLFRDLLARMQKDLHEAI